MFPAYSEIQEVIKKIITRFLQLCSKHNKKHFHSCHPQDLPSRPKTKQNKTPTARHVAITNEFIFTDLQELQSQCRYSQAELICDNYQGHAVPDLAEMNYHVISILQLFGMDMTHSHRPFRYHVSMYGQKFFSNVIVGSSDPVYDPPTPTSPNRNSTSTSLWMVVVSPEVYPASLHHTDI